MALGNNSVLSDAAVFQKILLSVGGVAIITIGAWTADTLRDLTKEVQALRYSMLGLSAKVDGMPPRDLILRIEILEKETQKLEEKINRLHQSR